MTEKNKQVIYVNGEPVYDVDGYTPGKQKPSKGSKRCKNCGAMLPGNAGYCDICGTPCSDTIPSAEYARREHNRHVSKKAAKGCLIFVVIALVMLLIISYAAFQFHELRNEYFGQGDPSTWKNYVTAEQFEKIKYDMSYEEVSKILGEGVLEASYDGGDYLFYFWPGENRIDTERYSDTLEAYIQITYSNGEMSSLEERNIIKGKEVKANFEAGTDIDAPLVTKESAHKIEEGMDINTVSHILGGKGVLLDERTNIYSANSVYTYETYGWKCTDNGIPNIFEVQFRDNKVYYVYVGEYMD